MVDFELSNFDDDDCTKGELKVQPCDATWQVLTAYKSAPGKENIKIELPTILEGMQLYNLL